MSDFHFTRTVRTRKGRRCAWCDESIVAGERCAYVSGVYEGDFLAYYLHAECEKACCQLYEPLSKGGGGWEYDECWSFGEFRRGSTRLRFDRDGHVEAPAPTHPEAANRNGGAA